MSDMTRVGSEVETPVNPYSLLDAVNSSSDTAHTAWLIFLVLMTYLVVAVAGVTHKALLLELAVALPLLQVQIPITQFFQFAPIILVLLHIGVVGQLVLLARKTIEFDHAIVLLEATDRRSHPLRLELHNFFFVQAIAGPHRSRIMSAFLHAMSWLTLVILPVMLILYVQVVFLPYHDVAITWTHRVVLLLDIAMLMLIGVFLMRSETSFFHAFWRTTTAHPLSFFMTGLVLAASAFFSLFVATVPGEPFDRMMQVFAPAPADRLSPSRDQRHAASFVLPWFGARPDGSLFGFHRNLVVTDTDLVVDKDVNGDEPSIILRGRDLRFARLDRSDLHQADLTGADLSDASLVGTDLRKAFLNCASLDDLLLSENRELARCVTARRANLRKARLQDAQLNGIDLRGAVLDDARLEGAELGASLLTGANFSNAHLDRADLTGAQAQGANFLVASLQGADLSGAQLQSADLSSTSMQGAVLSFAHLQGAVLRDADLEGADLYYAKLHGADMTGARIRAADLRGAGVWLTAPPAHDNMSLTDLTDIVIKPVDESELPTLVRVVERVEVGLARQHVKSALDPIMQIAASRAWVGSNDQLRWDSMAKASGVATADAYKLLLTEHLSRLMCRTRWSSGSMATGVARRAQAPHFRGDVALVFDRTRGPDCPGGLRVAPKVLGNLGHVADIARSN